MIMCLLALVAQVGFAEERVGNTLVYDFNGFSEGSTFTEGSIVKNSLGENMTI